MVYIPYTLAADFLVHFDREKATVYIEVVIGCGLWLHDSYTMTIVMYVKTTRLRLVLALMVFPIHHSGHSIRTLLCFSVTVDLGNLAKKRSSTVNRKQLLHIRGL